MRGKQRRMYIVDSTSIRYPWTIFVRWGETHILVVHPLPSSGSRSMTQSSNNSPPPAQPRCSCYLYVHLAIATACAATFVLCLDVLVRALFGSSRRCSHTISKRATRMRLFRGTPGKRRRTSTTRCCGPCAPRCGSEPTTAQRAPSEKTL